VFVLLAVVVSAQNNTTPSAKSGAADNSAARDSDFQAAKEMRARENAEIRVLSDAVRAARQRQRKEIKAVEEQLRNLRVKHRAELAAFAKQERSIREKYRAGSPASTGSRVPASGAGLPQGQ